MCPIRTSETSVGPMWGGDLASGPMHVIVLQKLLEILLGNTLVRTLTCIVGLAYGFYWYMTSRFNYWEHRGVCYDKPQFLFGSMKDVITFRLHGGSVYRRIYNTYREKKFVGIFFCTTPTLLVNDLDLIKFILTKGFDNFTNRGALPKIHKDIMQNNLFVMEGEEWREMRRKLTPTFTSNKMKNMYLLMEQSAKNLRLEVDKLSDTGVPVNLKQLISRFTSDIIASCAYGLEVDSLRNPNTQFYCMTQKLFAPSRLTIAKMIFVYFFPRLFNFLGLSISDKEVSDYLPALVKATIEQRKKNNVFRGDFLDILVNIGKDRSGDDLMGKDNNELVDDKKGQETVQALTLEEISAQTFIFFFAGFETAASTMTFCLYELARQPDLQERLRLEILTALRDNNGVMTYEALHGMTYMEMVIKETLRMYASLPFLSRTCVEPTCLPGTDWVFEKGLSIIIPTFAIHHDPLYYPDPEHFDPERFTEDQISKRHPYTFLPFGEGPRKCIGIRFGKMQVKIGLCSLLSKFQFTLTPDTPVPMPISTSGIVTTPAHPINFIISKYKKP